MKFNLFSDSDEGDKLAEFTLFLVLVAVGTVTALTVSGAKFSKIPASLSEKSNSAKFRDE